MDRRCTGTDGKSYPQRWLRPEDRDFLIGRAHYLAHDEGLSVRQIVARFSEDHNVRRSVGSVSSYLNDHRCRRCSGDQDCSSEQNRTPEQSGEECSGVQNQTPEQAQVDP